MRIAYADLWQYPYLRQLPCYVLNGTNWYAPDAAIPADCLNLEDLADNTPASLDGLDFYPSAYYSFLSLFTQGTIRESVAVWRIVNISIALLMSFGALRLSRPEHRRPLALAWLVSSVPLGLFLISSINPSSWGVIGTAALVGPAIALLTSPWDRRLSLVRLAFVCVAVLMTVGARSEGPFHLAVAALVVTALSVRLPSRPAPRFALIGSAAVLLLGAVLVVWQSDKLRGLVERVLDGTAADARPQLTSGWDALLRAPGLFAETLSPALGWAEFGMPWPVGVLVPAAFWGACFFGLAVFFRRKALALALLVPVAIVVPAITFVQFQATQPRYFLPLVYVFAFALLATPAGRFLPEMSGAQKVGLILALSIANSLSLLQTTVRYVSGLTPGATDPRVFSAHPVPDWWWDHWLSPFGNWVLGSVAFAVGCSLLLRNPGPLYPKDSYPQHSGSDQPTPVPATVPANEP